MLRARRARPPLLRLEKNPMTLIFGILMVATVAVSILLSSLGKLSLKETLLQTMAMSAGALIFFGLVMLVESATH